MHNLVLNFFDFLSAVILTYFVTANVIYTLLMIVSLYFVTLHARYGAGRFHQDLLATAVTPPVCLIVPAYNERDTIVQTVMGLRALRYPEKEIIVVDDGSIDDTVAVLMDKFKLFPMDLAYREWVPAKAPFAFYHNPEFPELVVVSKPHAGKPDSLNVGINLARSPYFCTVDADSVIEDDALLRLMAPVVRSNVNTVVSGGVVRVVNGCTVHDGRIAEIDLPKRWLELCQVIEYIRSFLFGRPGWSVLGTTFICSGAFCIFHRETVVVAGGFSSDTVTEDVDIIATIHQTLRERGWKYRMAYTTEPVCWTEAPKTIGMFARQRRRWQLGLTQTVMKHDRMMFNPKFGLLGMVCMPFHAYVEALGCVLEASGTLLVPLTFLVGAMPVWLFFVIVFLAVGYGMLLSMGAVVLQEVTRKRYPNLRHVITLMIYSVIEGLGYRQMGAIFRAQGVLQYFMGAHKWEVVKHEGVRVQPSASEAAS